MPLNILYLQGTNEQRGPYVELRQWSDEHANDVILEFGCNSEVIYDTSGYVSKRKKMIEPSCIVLSPGGLAFEYIRQAIAKYDELDEMFSSAQKVEK